MSICCWLMGCPRIYVIVKLFIKKLFLYCANFILMHYFIIFNLDLINSVHKLIRDNRFVALYINMQAPRMFAVVTGCECFSNMYIVLLWYPD